MEPGRQTFHQNSEGQLAAQLQGTPLLNAVDKVTGDLSKSGAGAHTLSSRAYPLPGEAMRDSADFGNQLGFGGHRTNDAYQQSENPVHSSKVCGDSASGVQYITNEYQQNPYPMHAYQHPHVVGVQRQESCMNFYWLLYILGWVFCFPPMWIGGAFGIRSRKENERIAGWVSVVTCIVITITVIVPAIIVVVIATNSPFDDDEF